MAAPSTARGASSRTWLLIAAALPFILMLAIKPVRSAPVTEDEQRHQLEPYDEESGCYYNYQHYGEGDRIITNEPCLNCTCHNRMLMCYLRVCPFTKAIGQDCTVEKRADQCCPVITCPEVPVTLLSHPTPSTTHRPAVTSSSNTHIGHPDSYGCTIDNEFYADGVQVPSDLNKPCELCYCIRNRTACVMQECTLHVEGCKPVYQDGVCCPVRYECDYPEDPTTVSYGGGLILTTTTTASPNLNCRYNDEEYADGALIHMEDKPCEHCYCMRGDIVCAVQECGTPLEKEGNNCTALPPQPGKCCPEMYQCDTGIEYVTDSTFRMNRKHYGNTYHDSLNEVTTAATEDNKHPQEPAVFDAGAAPETEGVDKVSEQPTETSLEHDITEIPPVQDNKDTVPIQDETQKETEQEMEQAPEYITSDEASEHVADGAEADVPQHVTEKDSAAATTDKSPEHDASENKPEHSEAEKIPEQEPDHVPEKDAAVIDHTPEHDGEQTVSDHVDDDIQEHVPENTEPEKHEVEINTAQDDLPEINESEKGSEDAVGTGVVLEAGDDSLSPALKPEVTTVILDETVTESNEHSTTTDEPENAPEHDISEKIPEKNAAAEEETVQDETEHMNESNNAGMTEHDVTEHLSEQEIVQKEPEHDESEKETDMTDKEKPFEVDTKAPEISSTEAVTEMQEIVHEPDEISSESHHETPTETPDEIETTPGSDETEKIPGHEPEKVHDDESGDLPELDSSQHEPEPVHNGDKEGVPDQNGAEQISVHETDEAQVTNSEETTSGDESSSSTEAQAENATDKDKENITEPSETHKEKPDMSAGGEQVHPEVHVSTESTMDDMESVPEVIEQLEHSPPTHDKEIVDNAVHGHGTILDTETHSDKDEVITHMPVQVTEAAHTEQNVIGDNVNDGQQTGDVDIPTSEHQEEPTHDEMEIIEMSPESEKPSHAPESDSHTVEELMSHQKPGSTPAHETVTTQNNHETDTVQSKPMENNATEGEISFETISSSTADYTLSDAQPLPEQETADKEVGSHQKPDHSDSGESVVSNATESTGSGPATVEENITGENNEFATDAPSIGTHENKPNQTLHDEITSDGLPSDHENLPEHAYSTDMPVELHTNNKTDVQHSTESLIVNDSSSVTIGQAESSSEIPPMIMPDSTQGTTVEKDASSDNLGVQDQVNNSKPGDDVSQHEYPGSELHDSQVPYKPDQSENENIESDDSTNMNILEQVTTEHSHSEQTESSSNGFESTPHSETSNPIGHRPEIDSVEHDDMGEVFTDDELPIEDSEKPDHITEHQGGALGAGENEAPESPLATESSIPDDSKETQHQTETPAVTEQSNEDVVSSTSEQVASGEITGGQNSSTETSEDAPEITSDSKPVEIDEVKPEYDPKPVDENHETMIDEPTDHPIADQTTPSSDLIKPDESPVYSTEVVDDAEIATEAPEHDEGNKVSEEYLPPTYDEKVPDDVNTETHHIQLSSTTQSTYTINEISTDEADINTTPQPIHEVQHVPHGVTNDDQQNAVTMEASGEYTEPQHTTDTNEIVSATKSPTSDSVEEEEITDHTEHENEKDSSVHQYPFGGAGHGQENHDQQVPMKPDDAVLFTSSMAPDSQTTQSSDGPTFDYHDNFPEDDQLENLPVENPDADSDAPDPYETEGVTQVPGHRPTTESGDKLPANAGHEPEKHTTEVDEFNFQPEEIPNTDKVTTVSTGTHGSTEQDTNPVEDEVYPTSAPAGVAFGTESEETNTDRPQETVTGVHEATTQPETTASTHEKEKDSTANSDNHSKPAIDDIPIPSLTDVHITDQHPAMQDAEETNPEHFDEFLSEMEQEGKPEFTPEDIPVKPSFPVSTGTDHDVTESTSPAMEDTKHPEGTSSTENFDTSVGGVTEIGDVDSITKVPATQSPSFVPDDIPGEGSCLVDGKLFPSGSHIPTANPCQESCECKASIVHCTLRTCAPPPANNPNCMPVVPDGKCCPTYTCVDDEGHTTAVIAPITDNVNSADGSVHEASSSTTALPHHDAEDEHKDSILNQADDLLNIDSQPTMVPTDTEGSTESSISDAEKETSSPITLEGEHEQTMQVTDAPAQPDVSTTMPEIIDQSHEKVPQGEGALESDSSTLDDLDPEKEHESLPSDHKQPTNEIYPMTEVNTESGVYSTSSETQKPEIHGEPMDGTEENKKPSATFDSSETHDETQSPTTEPSDAHVVHFSTATPIEEAASTEMDTLPLTIAPKPQMENEPATISDAVVDEQGSAVTHGSTVDSAENTAAPEFTTLSSEEMKEHEHVSSPNEESHEQDHPESHGQDQSDPHETPVSHPADDQTAPVEGASFETHTTPSVDESSVSEMKPVESTTTNPESASTVTYDNGESEMSDSHVQVEGAQPEFDGHEEKPADSQKPSDGALNPTESETHFDQEEAKPVDTADHKPGISDTTHSSEIEQSKPIESSTVVGETETNAPSHSESDEDIHEPSVTDTMDHSEGGEAKPEETEAPFLDGDHESKPVQAEHETSTEEHKETMPVEAEVAKPEETEAPFLDGDHESKPVQAEHETSTEEHKETMPVEAEEAKPVVSDGVEQPENESFLPVQDSKPVETHEGNKPGIEVDAPETADHEGTDISHMTEAPATQTPHETSSTESVELSIPGSESPQEPSAGTVLTAGDEEAKPAQPHEETEQKPEEDSHESSYPTHQETMPQFPDPVLPDMEEEDDTLFPGFPGQVPDPGSDYMPSVPSYEGDDHQASFGPGTCRYGGKIYVSAQQIPRDDPCDFCFCFRSDIICLQQSCPPPIRGCHEEAIEGFCCPRYECPVPMGNMNSTTTTTTTTLPPDLISSYVYGRQATTGCLVQGTMYHVGEEITVASGPCLECRCGGDSKMKCEPKACSPQPMLRKMMEAVSLRR